MTVSFSPDWRVLDDYPDLVTLQNKQKGLQLGFNIVNNAKLADPVDGHRVPFPDLACPDPACIVVAHSPRFNHPGVSTPIRTATSRNA